MSNSNHKDNPTFPNHYVPNSEKKSWEYGRRVFRAVMNATSAYRTSRIKQINEARKYAQGKQGIENILAQLNMDGNNMYNTIAFTPTPILSKFEKIVVDDYQQLQEEPKAIAESYAIQERKKRREADLRFRMEFGQDVANLEQLVGFKLEDDSKVPENEEELELITSLQPDEREELLVNQMLDFVLDDNDYESIKRQFLSDTFQVNFAGLYSYVDANGRTRIEFVPAEDAIYDYSKFEDFNDSDYQGSVTVMNISTIRSSYDVKPHQEHILFKLAKMYKDNYGNNSYISLPTTFSEQYRNSLNRPYDDFSVPVTHVWYKTMKMVGYVEGKNSYGNKIFDFDSKIENPEELNSTGTKRTGASWVETAYEGLFVGDERECLVLDWYEQPNQIRLGEEKKKVESPYIFFMPDNRGSMMVDSAVERVIPQIDMMDFAMFKIKMTIANHAPSGYAVDYEGLMGVTLGSAGELEPVDLEDIYKQTGRLYYKGTTSDGQATRIPITAMHSDLVNPINGYLIVYNQALNELRDNLGINPNREGTADLNRVATSVQQTQIAISQTATYYIYRAYVKATEKLLAHIGTRTWDALKMGNPNKGYLKYLGEANVEFIKEREEITKSTYKYKLSLQMTQEDRSRLDASINACLTAGTLEMQDALMIWNIRDFDIASKMLSYTVNKRKKELQKNAIETSRQSAEANAQAGVAVEREKQNTIQLQSKLDLESSKLREEGEKERALAQTVSAIVKANVEQNIPIPPMYLPLVEAYIESHTIRQEKQKVEAEMSIQQEMVGLQQQEQVAQIEQAYQSGQITQDEANMALNQAGVQ